MKAEELDKFNEIETKELLSEFYNELDSYITISHTLQVKSVGGILKGVKDICNKFLCDVIIKGHEDEYEYKDYIEGDIEDIIELEKRESLVKDRAEVVKLVDIKDRGKLAKYFKKRVIDTDKE